MKDRFSDNASGYARFRPEYPSYLFDHIYSNVYSFGTAWDAGTGNGQVATVLARKFNKVYATDISVKQLMKVPTLPNLSSFVADETAPQIADQSVDLVTVAQAIHWFDIKKFETELRRLVKPGGLIAFWGYGLVQLPDKCQPHLHTFYTSTVGPFWDPERKHIDSAYKNIRLDFEEIQFNESFRMAYNWDLEQFEGYLNTWSAVGNYKKEKNENPVPALIDALKGVAESNHFDVEFQLFLKLYRVG